MRQQIASALGEAYGLQVFAVAVLAGGADPDATAFRADTRTGPVFVKVQPLAAAHRAVVVAETLAVLAQPALLRPQPASNGSRVLPMADRGLTVWPFRAGRNGFEAYQSRTVLAGVGALLRAVHDLPVTGELRAVLPIDDRHDRWRAAARVLVRSPPPGRDAPGDRLRHILQRQGSRILALADGAETLTSPVPDPATAVLCHGDLHAGNVLVGPDGSWTVIDWDTAVLARRERDLMFPGAGIVQTWSDDAEIAAFRTGYDPTGAYGVDERAIACHRCDRFLEDLAVYARAITDDADPEVRQRGVARLEGQFQPGEVVDRAERSLARVQETTG